MDKKKTLASRLQRLWGKLLVLLGLKEKKRKTVPQFWRDSPEFVKIYKEIKGKTLVTPDRCFMIHKHAKECAQKQGDFAEVGVYKGGTARLIAKAANQTLRLFDTFKGMPRTHQNYDIHQEGDFQDTSLESVKNFLTEFGHVRFYQGFFPQSAQGLNKCRYAFVHIDVDIYQSVKDCLEYFYPRMVAGGAMIFDDYQWKDTPGVKRAIDEFLSDKNERPVETTLYQCMIMKD